MLYVTIKTHGRGPSSCPSSAKSGKIPPPCEPLRTVSSSQLADQSATNDLQDHEYESNKYDLQDGSNNAPSDLEKAEGETPSTSPSPPLSPVDPTKTNDDYPEGGLQAYLVVLGSFSGMLASLGTMNSIGTYQTYLSTHQLSSYSTSSIGWIFGLYAFLSFFCGVQVGPIFDAHGPRWLVAAGSVLLLLSTFLLPLCRTYWHFLLCFGLAGGMGTSLVFTPSISAVAHWFSKKRGTATGLAMTGGALGGVLFPLALQRLFATSGFATALYVQGGVDVVLLAVANLLIRSRLPPKPGGSVLPSARVFKDAAFSLTTAGTFFQEWGLFVPISYITAYALHSGAMGEEFAYQIIAVFNAASVFGRWLPGFVSDRWGRYNTMLLALALCGVAALALWLPASVLTAMGVRDHARITALSVIYAAVAGFGSGSNLSLTPVCVGQLCHTQEYGRYYATCYTIVSFATLTGIPIAGALVAACGGEYWGLVVWTGLCYAISFALFGGARVVKAGWGFRAIY